jgi:hypothetical protein
MLANTLGRSISFYQSSEGPYLSVIYGGMLDLLEDAPKQGNTAQEISELS